MMAGYNVFIQQDNIIDPIIKNLLQTNEKKDDKNQY